MNAEKISSTQNPRIKHLLALEQKSSLRRDEGLFVVEGRRELLHCLNSGYELDTLFVCDELTPQSYLEETLNVQPSTFKDCANRVQSSSLDTAEVQPILSNLQPSTFNVTNKVYARIALRGSTEGVIAIVKAKPHSLTDLALSPSPLIIVLESVEKPGNLGAVLRTADACKADAVIVCDPLTDLYNPNLIRSSIGAIFTVPTVACTSEEAIRFLQSHGIQILTAQLQDSELYYQTDMRRPTAIVMGTESTGLTTQWRQAATQHIRIPMLGQLDSLNVSVSAAVLVYEAIRQRQASKN